jgi:hypothetical protein
MTRFRGSEDGIALELNPSEVAILSRLATLVGGAGVSKDDPARQRLNPVIYPGDETASREFERLAAKERVEVRSADRELFDETLRRANAGRLLLTQDQAGAWARVLGEARIVLAARKGLFDSGLPTDLPTDPELALVLLLGHLQEELVNEMLRTMEDVK